MLYTRVGHAHVTTRVWLPGQVARTTCRSWSSCPMWLRVVVKACFPKGGPGSCMGHSHALLHPPQAMQAVGWRQEREETEKRGTDWGSQVLFLQWSSCMALGKKNNFSGPPRWNQHPIQPGFDVHHPALIRRETSGVSGEASTWKDAQWHPIPLDFWVTLHLEKHLETWHAGQ